MLQETRFQVQVLKPCKSIQESSEKVQDFKARQLASIEVYEIQCFRANFNPIHGYMFRLSFLTTLNIYKDLKFVKGYTSCTRAQFQKCEEKCDRKPSLP